MLKRTLPPYSLLLALLFFSIGVSIAVKNSHGKKYDRRLKPNVNYVYASYYDLRVITFKIFSSKQSQLGGSIELIDDNTVLLITGDGKSFILLVEENGIDIKSISLDFPMKLKGSSWHHRVTDIMVERREKKRPLIYIAATKFNEEQDCYTIRLSEAELILDDVSTPNWIERYKTQRCVKMTNRSGGRLAFLEDKSILITVGDFSKVNYPFKEDSPYGKVIKLNRENWRSSIFSSGHRNPQGLLVDGSEIWATEHGPEGGDELNLLTEGKDYGWPSESYGTDYGKKTFNGSVPGDHSGSTRPVYAWTPSIGVSNLIRIRGDAFPDWKNDLMVATLRGGEQGRSLYRVRIREGRAIVVERIETGQPIRDLVELSDGRLILWNGKNKIQIVEPGNKAFSACNGCHALSRAGTHHGIGPDLTGILGRKVAGQKNFDYSSALKNFGGKWTASRLDTFLANPQATVPGTSMDYGGVNDPLTRKEIIEYLSSMPRRGR